MQIQLEPVVVDIKALISPALVKSFDKLPTPWRGRPTHLLCTLERIVFEDPDRIANQDGSRFDCLWPADAAQFGKQLRVIRPLLADRGIAVWISKSTGNQMIVVQRMEHLKPAPSAA